MRRAPVLIGVLVAFVLALASGPAAAVAAPLTVTKTVTSTAGAPATAGGTTNPLQPVVRDGPTEANKFETPATMDTPPRGHVMTARQAQRLARSDPKMQQVRRDNPGSYDRIFLKGQYQWQLSIYKKGKPLTEIGQLVIDDASKTITESWDVPYVAWTMARGIDGAFGRSITNPWLWGVLLILFLVPFVGLRPVRGPPVPLLLLAGFTAPLAFFNNARLDWAVPLSFGLLLSLFVWAVVRGLRKPRSEARTVPILLPTGVLLVLGVALLVFRAILNVEDGNVIDVGYASVVGADKIGHGLTAYGVFPDNVGRGDTYGPLTYLAYVPFEQLFPWSGNGKWDDLPAAHAAAIAIDALAAAVLFFVGRSQEEDRASGHRRGVLYAYLWLACPWTAYCLNSNSNDALPAVMLGLVLLAGAKPFLRGMAAGAAGASKIAPFVILPLLMSTRRVAPSVRVSYGPPSFWPLRGSERPAREAGRGVVSGVVLLAGALVLVFVVSVIVMRGFTFGHLFDRTIGYQAGRPAPFMPWGFYDALGWMRNPVRVVAILFGVAIALFPRRHDVTGTAALVLAVILGLQMATEYWFYLYLVWLIPLIVAAGLADRPLRWPGVVPGGRPAVVPRMHGPIAEEDAPWAADVRRREAARLAAPRRPPEHGSGVDA
ncbi:hypothetical protein AB0L40_08910 [Patulibacter sp. NPDC049589]|uniref:hypothetical protein n=1 Tax=Patulibacter sp. NPDC049589 TaxID=3154731 RepID=UPI003424608B